MYDRMFEEQMREALNKQIIEQSEEKKSKYRKINNAYL
jgi:hypothetical protein